jgi:hypothetical protein
MTQGISSIPYGRPIPSTLRYELLFQLDSDIAERRQSAENGREVILTVVRLDMGAASTFL